MEVEGTETPARCLCSCVGVWYRLQDLTWQPRDFAAHCTDYLTVNVAEVLSVMDVHQLHFFNMQDVLKVF